MNGRNSYLVVGIFVSLGLLALVSMILLLAGGRSSESSSRYTVLFERDISGLTLGAPVRYLGVPVGKVVDLRLAGTNSAQVRVDIDVFESTPVNSLTYASLAFQGVTGVAFISLAADSGGEARPLVAAGSEYPVIPARDTGLAALLADGPEIASKVSALLDKASLLLDDENRSNLSRSLANIEVLTESLAAQEDTIGQLPDQLHTVLEQIETTLGNLQQTLDKAEPDLTMAMESLNETSNNLARISGRIDGWLQEHDGDMQSFIDGGLAQTPALISDTRNSIRELEKLLAELRENPSKIIYKRESEAVNVDP